MYSWGDKGRVIPLKIFVGLYAAFVVYYKWQTRGRFHQSLYDVLSSYIHRTNFLGQKSCFIKLSKAAKFLLFVLNLR